MCKRNGESVHHLLLCCDVGCALWNVVFMRFWLSWVMLSRVVDLLVGGLLVALRLLLCGRWCLLASCGAFGGK
jgi:hypothetical protein